MSKLKDLPPFESEAAEQALCESHGSSEYVDWKQVKPVSMPNLKSATKAFLLRFAEGLLESSKI